MNIRLETTLAAVGGGVLALALAAGLPVQAQDAKAGIYSCVDSKGRKLTSDRPIAECSDREQKLLNPSGTVRAKVGPTLTAPERAEADAREKLELEERARRDEDKRRDRALLARYPGKAVHDAERAEALKQIGVVKAAATNRVEELKRQGVDLDAEMEFYKKDPSKAPPPLRRQVDELAKNMAVQKRFIADQDAEISRVNARFDEELVRLKQLWALRNSAPVAASAGAAAANPATAKTR
jgi:Domain of unknown function (DUF4124)